MAKLRLNQTTHVAVGFLHAGKNPAHEQMVVDYFREQGFRALGSAEFGAVKEERPRIWAAVVENYVDDFLLEKVKELTEAVTSAGLSAEQTLLNGQSLADYQEQKRRWFRPQNFWRFPRPTLYCGIDEFHFFATQPAEDLWNAPFGRVALPAPRGQRVTPGPLHVVSRNFWDRLQWTEDVIEIEPGPICFGKALTLTMMDIFAHHGELNEIQGVSERITDRSRKKIADTLRAYGRGTRQDDRDIVDGVLRVTGESWRLQFPVDALVELQGPLAPAVHKVLKHSGLEAAVKMAGDVFISELMLREEQA